MILGLIMLVGYYGALIVAMKFCNVDFLKIFREEYVKISILMLIGTVFVYWQISLQKWIYFWDLVETWRPSITTAQLAVDSPLKALEELRNSINYSDYNNFIPILITLPMLLFGKSFLAYTMYVWVMFGLPSIFVIAAATKTLIEKHCGEKISCAAVIGILLLVPLIELPVMNGYANISIMLPGTILFLMLLNLDEEKIQLPQLFLIALMAIFAVIQSRSAAYMVIGIFFSYIVYKIYLRANIIAVLKNIFIIGAIGLGITAILFLPFLERTILYNHAMAYSAYAAGHSVPMRILGSVLMGGLTTFVIFFVGILAGLRSKNFRPLTILLTIWTATTIILICRIQFMSMQHYYTMLIPFCIITTTIILSSFRSQKKICAILALLLTFNFAQTYLEDLPFKINGYEINFKYTPPVRNDIDELKNLVNEINARCADGNKKAYLLSSSGLYNSSSFQQVNMPDKLDAIPNLFPTADVDLRDGFPINFLDADIVIVSEPVQTHLRPQDQQVVVKPAELITNTPLPEHFKMVHETTLFPNSNNEDGVKFKIYEKIVPFTQTDIDFIEKVFTEIYPNNPELFKNRFDNYKKEHFHE